MLVWLKSHAELIYVVIKGKILETLDHEVFTLEGNIKFWGAVPPSNAITQVILESGLEIGSFNAAQGPQWTSLFRDQIKMFVDSTVLISNFFFLD